jgi:hypothetical protein
MNNEQNRINNKHAATTNKTGSIIDMQEQRTEPDQQQTCRKINRIGSTTDMPEQRTESDGALV